jgi:hypothetical protein
MAFLARGLRASRLTPGSLSILRTPEVCEEVSPE